VNSVREAKPEDKAEIIEIWRACDLVKPQNDPSDDFDLALQTSTSTIFVLNDSTRMIGAVMAGFDGHRGWFYYLGVLPQFQNGGNGRLLVEAAEQWLTSQGAPKTMLMVRDTNTKVIAFYEKLGYNVEQTRVLGKRF
jgi:ribosomal protein S18 acetylase RimI-like enzyme